MNIRSVLAAAVVVLLALSMVGCSSSPIDILNLAIGAAEVALPIVQAAGVPASVVTIGETALSAASNFVGQSSDVLANSQLTDAQKAAAITAAGAGIVSQLQAIPPQYQAVANALASVAQYVIKFLATLPKPAPPGAAVAHVASGTVHVPSKSDQAKLLAIKARAQALRAKLPAK